MAQKNGNIIEHKVSIHFYDKRREVQNIWKICQTSPEKLTTCSNTLEYSQYHSLNFIAMPS